MSTTTIDFEHLKHDLSVLGLSAHLHKPAPDLAVVAELVAALNSAHTALESAAQRERNASAIVDAAREAARVTHEHASALVTENATLRAQSRRLAERLDAQQTSLVAASAAAELSEKLQAELAEQAHTMALLAAEVENVPTLRGALARAEARARDADSKRRDAEAALAARTESALKTERDLDASRHQHTHGDAALRAEVVRLQRLLDETRGLHTVALAALDEQSRARAIVDADCARLRAHVEQLADADEERDALLAELNEAYKRLDDVEQDRVRLIQLLHECERSLADLQLAVDLTPQQPVAAAPVAVAPVAVAPVAVAPVAATTTTTTTTNAVATDAPLVSHEMSATPSASTTIADEDDAVPDGDDGKAAAAAIHRGPSRQRQNGDVRSQSGSPPPPPEPRGAAPGGMAALESINHDLRLRVDSLKRENVQLRQQLAVSERNADERVRVAEQHQRDLAKWVDELRKYITDTTTYARERELEQEKKCAQLEQQANQHGAELAAVERERDALQHYISCYEAELIKTTVRY
jgi:chromosome segregation ATPase